MAKKLFFCILAGMVILSGCGQADPEDPLTASKSPPALTDENSLPSHAEREDSVSQSSQSSAGQSARNPSATEESSQTSSEVSSSDDFHKEQEQLAAIYQKSLENATALEQHLRSVLSPKDHGGIYMEERETATLTIWVANQNAVDTALQSYKGDAFAITQKTAGCSLDDMNHFAKLLAGIEVEDGEMLTVYISESYNAVAVNIAKQGEARLRDAINALVQTNHFPTACITIFTIDPAGENPVT